MALKWGSWSSDTSSILAGGSMSRVYFESDVVVVTWEAEQRAVLLAWKGHAKGEKFRQGLDKGLELVKQHGAARWIGDCTLLGVLSQEDQDWTNTNWFPRLLQTPVSRMAVLIPKSALTRMSVDSILSKVEGTNLTTCYFSDLAEARGWVVDVRKAA
jgi:hypothetical protein